MKESLRQKQSRFTIMISHLIIWAYAQGYEMTEGDSFRDPRVHGAQGVKGSYSEGKSAHKNRLARDLNLFKNGKFLQTTEDHKPIGEKWESMGGTWGGRFNDGNHYSLEHNGVK